ARVPLGRHLALDVPVLHVNRHNLPFQKKVLEERIPGQPSGNTPGRRVAPGVTPWGSPRSVLAQLRHTARQVTGSLTRFAIRGRCVNRAIAAQCPRPVSRPQLHDPAPPSLGRVLAVRVPRLPRYYEGLRLLPPRLAELLGSPGDTLAAPGASLPPGTD